MEESSLAYHMMTNVVMRTLRHGTNDRAMFLQQDFARTNFVRNPRFWLKDCPEITAVLIGAGYTNLWRDGGGAAISPRHVMMSAHAAHATGATLLFIDDQGMPVTRKVVGCTNMYNMKNDLSIALLDSDLPPSIHPFKLFHPASVPGRLPEWMGGKPLQIVAMDKFKEWFPRVSTQKYGPVVTAVPSSTWVTDDSWSKIVGPGTSGHPICAVVGTNLVLLGHWTTPGSGPNYTYWWDTINAGMRWLNRRHRVRPAYQLQAFDLSGWGDRSP